MSARLLSTAHEHPRHVVLFALAAGLLLGPLWLPGLLAAALLAAAVARPPVLALFAAAAVLAGAVLAEARLAALDAGPLAAMHGERWEGRAVLLEPVRARGRGPAVARVRLPALGDVAVARVRNATRRGGAWPQVGDVVALAGRIEPLGRFDAYQRRRGAHAAIAADRFAPTGERRGGVAGVLDGIRRRGERGLERGLAPPEAALLRGMALGQDERLGEDVRNDFQRAGLAHLLAASGQNVILLATLVLGAGALVGTGLRARLFAALVLVAVYVPLAGGGPSIQRAGVMGGAGLVAALAGRPSSRWYALGLAAVITLALNPRASGEPGWQLSFAAVVGLLALVPSLREALRRRRIPGPLVEAGAVTIAATLATAPLMAFHFEQVSLASLPANLLAAPAVAPIMWLGMLAEAVAQVSPVLCGPLNVLNGFLLAFVEWVAHVAALPGAASVHARIGGPLELALSYLGLAALALAVRAAWRRRPLGGPHGGRSAALGCAALLAVALLARAGSAAPRSPAAGELVVSFLDIGQGDATLLQRDGVAVLVDTGPPDGPILRRLAESGVKRLDALLITHAEADHEGAALAVVRALRPRLVLDGGAGWPTAVQRGLARSGVRAVGAHRGQVLALGGIRLSVLWPPPPGPGWVPEGNPNERAVVALVQAGEFDLLLPADAESDVTSGLALPHVEALKVAHHGSADPGLPAELARLRPRFAAIEVGSHNTYGHPTASTLAALRGVPTVVRTDRDGTVRLRVRGRELRVQRTSGQRP